MRKFYNCLNHFFKAMKSLYLSCISLLIPSVLFAQNGVLKGHVTDKQGYPLSGISVSLEGTNQATVTSSSGSFTLEDNAGTYILAFHASGHEAKMISVTIDKNDTTHISNIQLNQKNNRLNEITINGIRNDYKTDRVSNSLKLLTPLELVPQNIQVVTAAVLTDRQIISMKDGVISNVSGATRLEHWDNYTRINMRGTRASEFRNGFNVTSNWGPLTADMSMVDRIEFVKGPAGFMMSNGEPGGMFNIVTKKPTGETKGNVDLAFGSFDLYRAALDLDGHLDKKNRLQYRLNLMGQTQNSFQNYKFDKRYTIHPVLKYIINDKTDVTLEYALQHATLSNLGTSYLFSPNGYGDLPRDMNLLEPDLAPTKIDDQSLFVYLHHYFNDNWKLSVRAAYLNSKQMGSSAWPGSMDSAGNMIRNISLFDALNESKFGQAFLNGKIQTGSVAHKIIIGLDMGDKQNTYDWSQSHALDTREHPFNIYHPNYGTPANGYPDFDRSKPLTERADASRINQSYSGIYLQDELGFFEDKVRLTIAGRFTHVKQATYGDIYSASKVTPRLGLSVSVAPDANIYALFDQSFIPQSGLLRGDKLPKPETGSDYELGIKKSWFGNRLQSTLSAYSIYKNGLLVSDPDTTGNADHRYSLQLGQARTNGVELDIRGEIARGLSIIANYAYTNSEITKDINETNVGKPLPGFAKNIINGWLNYQIHNGALNGLGFSLGATYRADRSTWSWASENQKSLPDYFRMDAGLSYKVDHLKINLAVNNLLNDYLYEGAPYGNFYYWQMEAPRNFRLGFSYDF